MFFYFRTYVLVSGPKGKMTNKPSNYKYKGKMKADFFKKTDEINIPSKLTKIRQWPGQTDYYKMDYYKKNIFIYNFTLSPLTN